MEEAPPPPPVNLNNISPLMKTEVIEPPVLPEPTPISATEPSVAPPTAITTPMVTVPIAPAQPLLTSTPSAPIKKPKRVCRT